ncbi:hypothetical protein Cs308_0783 [Candidatus Chlamydia sanziniae]|uniref:Uncharacterized protein n=1 Tax=Candidatus Chlamydia sanziniae TaxID=1806891 RepID=A0A1A9HXY8_9CHLA|nr:hypothetical protein Cs308_0783 [Candidatus Chlamydia sanziniae]
MLGHPYVFLHKKTAAFQLTFSLDNSNIDLFCYENNSGRPLQ